VIAERPNPTPAEMRERAEAWFNRQVELLAKAHGSSWPAHRLWVEGYLREEIRERLIALGWRPKK
jgi:hypothetical protein